VSATKEVASVAAALRGRFVEGKLAGEEEETTDFLLEDVTVIEADPEAPPHFDPEGEMINLNMPLAVSGENWVGKEVEVEGRFEQEGEPEGARWVFVVEEIDEV
jgi:hypothetical protein